jgi:hypothetical protein
MPWKLLRVWVGASVIDSTLQSHLDDRQFLQATLRNGLQIFLSLFKDPGIISLLLT